MKQLLSLASWLRAKHLLVCLMFLLSGLPLTVSAAQTYLITSQADWENFVKEYDCKTEVSVILNCDVKLETQGIQVEKLVGTLDGQGHAFVFNYKDDKNESFNLPYYDKNWTEDSAPFGSASGTIKDLRLTGTIATRYGMYAYRMNNPLIQKLEGEVTIENCYSDVSFYGTDTMGDFLVSVNQAYIGGFIGEVSGGTVTFNNCSFTGSFLSTALTGFSFNDTGGFIGHASGSTIKIKNCFSYITYEDDKGSFEFGQLDYFLGDDYTGNSIEISNSYGYSINRKGEIKKLPQNETGCFDLADYGGAEFISNGGLTMALNAGGDGSNLWAQTVGSDPLPVLKTFSPKSETLVNLVANGYFNKDLTDWTSTRTPDAADKDGNGNYYWRTGNREITLTQTVDLTKRYTEAQLTKNTYDALMTCDWAHEYGYRVLKANYAFLDADGNQLQSFDLIPDPAEDCADEPGALTWTSVGNTITLPSGTRKVKITLSGCDYKGWAGNFGPAFDNVSLALVTPNSNPTVNDTIYINSQDDWEYFCRKYNNKTNLKVKLNCDVKFNKKGYMLSLFSGTLDGQGHAFILDYKDNKSGDQNKDYYDSDWDEDSAPFNNASGTIKNLRITGTVAIRYGILAYRKNNPLAAAVIDSLTLDNCHCDVAFVNTGTSGVGGDSKCLIGGFIGDLGTADLVTFNNCSFTGSFTYTDTEGHDYYYTGGFVGKTYDYSKVKFNNCFSHITYDDRGTVVAFSYYVGYVDPDAKITFSNSYGYCVNKSGKMKTLPNKEKCTVLSETEAQLMRKGWLTWKLNGGDGASNTWVQTIGTDSVPRLRTFYPTSLEVFYKDDTTHETTANGWSTIISPFDISLPTGVTPYVVTGVNEADKKITVSPYSGSTARVPLLLRTDGSSQTITVPAGYYNKYNAVGYLRGAYEDLEASDQYRVADPTTGNFVKPTATIPAWSCYLSGLTADTYTLDTSGSDYGTVVLISSEDDWNSFCLNYSGKKVTAYLGNDIILSKTDQRMEKFIGTLDGQGYYLWKVDTICAFNYAEGTIKNLRVVTGGSFIKPVCTNLSFIDCKSTGWLHGGKAVSGVTYTHTFEYQKGTGYVCYDTTTKHTTVDASVFESGEVTYKLNAGRTGSDAVWKQIIGKELQPQLLDDTSKEVFMAVGCTREATADKWTTLYFPGDVTLPDGVEQYLVGGVENDVVSIGLRPTNTAKAGTPVLLYAAGGMPQLTLPTLYYNEQPSQEGNLLKGVIEETAASDQMRTLSESDGVATFSKPADGATVPAWQCFLDRSDYDVYKISNAGLIIASKDDWNAFKTNYTSTEVNARLATDLTLTDDDAPMASFKGTFDGQGHTITVDYSRGTESSIHAPFQQAAGTIKNLQLTGTISVTNNSTVGRIYAAPLIYEMKGSKDEPLTLNVENCHSNVTFQEDNVGKGFLDAGGFVRQTSAYTTLNFTDCSFTGAFNTTGPLLGVGCFVGNTANGNSIAFTFTNCFSDASGSTFGSIATYDGASYLVRYIKSSSSLTVTNCSAVKVGDFYAPTWDGTGSVNLVDSATAASGSQAYALNAGRTGSDAPWTQTIGTDAVPQLKLFAEDSKEVHEANGGDYKLSTAGWGTLYYPGDVALAEGVKAYTVSNVEEKTADGTTENYVVLTAVEGSTLPAYTAAILCSLAEGETTATEKIIPLATYYYNNAKEQTEGEGMTAMLYGVLEPTDALDGSYVMQNQGGKVAFYQVDASVAQPTIPAFRCALLWAPTEEQHSDAKKVNLRFDDEATGINSVVEPLLNDGAVYDLQGRKVHSLQKGLVYIKNGQKFIVR